MLYDFRSEEDVQYVTVNEVSEIIDDIVGVYETLRRGEFMAVYAPAWMVYTIADYMVEHKGMYLDEESDAINGKPKSEETLLTIAYDGDLFVEEARFDKGGKLKRTMGILDYVYDGFKQKDVEHLSYTDDNILVFGFSDESLVDKMYDVDLETVDGLHGFEFSKSTDNGYCSYSFYTTEDLPAEVMQEIAEILK